MRLLFVSTVLAKLFQGRSYIVHADECLKALHQAYPPFPHSTSVASAVIPLLPLALCYR
jgi:hypothetical protein